MSVAEAPPPRAGEKTVTQMQYEMIADSPYKHTSDDVLFTVDSLHRKIPKNRLDQAREDFFAKGRPCFRASALTKRYRWGIHSDAKGRVAVYPIESSEYRAYANDENIATIKAMRTKRNEK